MHIAIDASRTTVSHLTGTEHYALQLTRQIIKHNPHHQITLYFRETPPGDLLPPSKFVHHKIIAFRRVWTHIRFATALWQDRPDVLFVPAHTLPFVFPGKAVVTVHDLGYKYFPQAHTRFGRFYLDLTTRYSAWRAAHILADSQATADDLSHFYHIPRHKIDVVYPGVAAPTLHDKAIQSKYNLPDDYFLFIGTLQPRKNIKRLVEAYQKYRNRVDTPIGLVLAGGKGWLFDEIWVNGVAGVHLPGFIHEADKGILLGRSTALVFPSLYEGFGFPVIEAMYCKTPVIASKSSSLPELVGDAGILVDAQDTEAIANAMLTIATHQTLRQSLIKKGLARAQGFTWENAATQTIQILEQVGGGPD